MRGFLTKNPFNRIWAFEFRYRGDGYLFLTSADLQTNMSLLSQFQYTQEFRVDRCSLSKK